MIGIFAGSALRMAFGGGWFLRALANLGSDFRALFAWLTTDAWKFLFFGSLVLFGVETLRYHSELRHSAKVEKQLTEAVNHSRQLQAALDALAAESKRQQGEVEKVVDHYITVTKPGLIKEREKIVHAPLPGQCKTPQEVLNADI